ncbi:MAG TPA: class I SAM-dependent methyltransferase [Chloroflexota bacterium]|nr:class I SAM-dependent methyltransferase [Chloroflexota bacterium]
MIPKPTHWSGSYGAWFKDPGIVDAYHLRPPYPTETFELLASLAVAEPQVVLDAGAGAGDIARELVPHVARIDAVDFSPGMIENGKRRTNGDHPNLRWIQGAVEDAPLARSYALITAGESLHWMAWDVVMPRFAEILTPNGVLAIVERGWGIADNKTLSERLVPIYGQYGASRDYQPTDLVAELTLRGLFQTLGSKAIPPRPWRPTLDEYVGVHHSQRSFSPERMGPDSVVAFDAAVRETIDDLCREGVIRVRDGRLELSVWAKVTWGKPLNRKFGG